MASSTSWRAWRPTILRAASSAAPAHGTSVRTMWMRARSTNIAATIVPMAKTVPLAASDSAGIDVPANGIAASSATAPMTAPAIGQTIRATRSSGP